MTDSGAPSPGSENTPPAAPGQDRVRPEELPPVEPPSAGYIIQLFLIPALIVAAVIGVWALFGKLAESDTDWEQLVVELGSSNEHRRWRAALGLAQVLRNQQLAPDENGVLLAEQPEVAKALSELLQETLNSESNQDEAIRHQEFLARTLGALKADDVVLPVLAEALSPDHDVEVRKSSLMSLAMIAGRHFESAANKPPAESTATVGDPENGRAQDESVYALKKPLSVPTISDESVQQQLKTAAQDEDPSIRHLAGYVLALVSGPDAMQQLKVMLLDGDAMARANAAVGLARNGLIDGVPVLIELLQEGVTAEKAHDAFGQSAIMSNSLRAIDDLWDEIPSDQQQQAAPLIRKIADQYAAADIRLQAQTIISRTEVAE